MSHKRVESQESISYQALLNENHALKGEIESLRERLAESEELKRAIGEGDLDALVIPGLEGELVFTLDSADRAYRVLVETMNEGTATLAFDGTILYCNHRFSELLNMPSQSIVGTSIYQFIAPESTVNFNACLKHKVNTGEINLKAKDGNSLPVLMSISSLQTEGSPNAWCLVVTDLTEQKKNEEIIASERLASSIIEQAVETIVICDTSGRIIRFSNSMPKLCGCYPTFQRFEDLIKLQFAEGKDKGESFLPVSYALRGSTILGMEAIFEFRDHKRFHLLLNSGPLKNNDGKIIGCVVTFTDITERKQAEEALRKSEEHYRMLFTNMTEGFGIIDVIYNNYSRPFDYRYIEINPTFERYLGVNREQLLGKTMRETFSTVSSLVIEKCEEVALSGQPINFEIFSQVANKYLDVHAFIPEKGKVALILRDVTERKKTEDVLNRAYNELKIKSEEVEAYNEDLQVYSEELQAQTEELQDSYQALSESEKRYHLLFNHSLDAIILTDPRDGGKILSANLAACQILGWPEEELIGKGRDSLFDPEDTVLSSLLNERANAGSARTQLTYRRKDGTKFIGELSTALFTDINGEPRAVAIIRDVTERIQMEEALRKSEEHYRLLFTNMSEGFILGEPIYNKDGIPCDYRFLDVNPAFELQTGLTRESVLGKTIMEVLHKPSRLAIEKYGEIALSGKSTHIEVFSQELDRYLDNYIFSPEKGKFAVIFRDITERKKLEEQTRQRAEELETVMEVAPVAIWIGHDPQSHNITGNGMANEFYEAEIGENVSANVTPVRRFFHEGYELTADELPMQQASLKNIDVRNSELDVLLPSGEWRTILGSASPLHDSEGHVRGSVGTFIDITDRKRIETALQKSEERYRMLFSNMTESFALTEVIYDKAGRPSDYRYLEINPAYERNLGIKREDVLGKTMLEIFRSTTPTTLKKFGEIALTGQPTQYEVFSQEANRYIDVYAFSPEKGKVAWIFRDITTRKEAEAKLKETLDNLDKLVRERTAELKKAYESLKESERDLAEAQKMSHIGNWSRNIETGEVHWSDEAYRIFGFKPQEFGVIYDAFLSRVHPDDRDFVISKDKEIIAGKLFDIDYRIIRTDGVERIVHEVVKVIFDEKNNPIRLNGTVHDITERKKAEEALAKIEIARKQEIHHRIKNNLQVISSLLDLQAEQFRGRKDIIDSEVLEAFKESQDRVISMALIHEELYKGGGFATLNFVPYIKELAENLLQTYNLRNADISLNMDLAENAFFDMDIAVPLGIIVNELVSNSLKHAFIGKDKGEIQISLCREEYSNLENEDCEISNFVLTVSDNGIGIPERLNTEDIDSLGMQLVTALVDQLDGEFELRRNNGTEFTIKFTITERTFMNSKS